MTEFYNMGRFEARCNYELDNNQHAEGFVNLVKEKLNDNNMTLLYVAKDEVYNHTVVKKMAGREI